MLKKLMLSTALTAAVATAALAQSPTSPSSSTPAPTAQSQGSGKTNFVSAQKPDQWLASKFKGTDVMGSDNQKIGDVSDILFDKTRQSGSVRNQCRRIPRRRLERSGSRAKLL